MPKFTGDNTRRFMDAAPKIQSHLMRHRRSTDARDSEIRDMIREVTEDYTWRVIHGGSGGRVAVALPTQRQRMRIKRALANGMGAL